MQDNARRTVILGAGISGLLAARSLKAAGRRVVVLDKGRSPGGRLATRRGQRAGERYDHGAQYLTARNPRLVELVRQWSAAGVVQVWSTGFAYEGTRQSATNETRYIGVQGMNGLARNLAEGLELCLDCTVVQAQSVGTHWQLVTSAGEHFEADELLLTAPVPQSLAVLAAGGVVLPLSVRAQLESIEYAPCLALLVALEGPSALPEPGGLWPERGPLSWIADNQRKGISAAPCLSLHADESFSRAHFAPEHDALATQALLEAARPWLGARVLHTQVHRWRFSSPLRTCPERCLLVDQAAPLVFAGDAFGGPRVEGAALSGWAAAEALLARKPGTLT